MHLLSLIAYWLILICQSSLSYFRQLWERMLSYFRQLWEREWGYLRQFWRATTELEGYDSGVVCLSHFASRFSPAAKIYLWNPNSNFFFELPPPPATPADSRPRNAAFRLGVGRDPSTGDLKVVRVCSAVHCPPYPCITDHSDYFNSFGYFHTFQADTQVSVYSLRQNSWRTIQWVPLVDPSEPDRFVKFTMCCRKSSVVVNSCIHWAAWTGWSTPASKVRGVYKFEIFAFDLATEVFRVMHPPQEVARVRVKDGLAELFGNLALVVRYYDQVDIWVMKRYNDSSSWTKQFSFKFSNLNLPRVRVSRIEVANNGQVRIWTAKGVIDYDLNTQTVIHLGPTRKWGVGFPPESTSL